MPAPPTNKAFFFEKRSKKLFPRSHLHAARPRPIRARMKKALWFFLS
jgi:hypothetical protein